MIYLTVKENKSEVESHFKSLKTDGVGFGISEGTVVWYEHDKPLTFISDSDSTFKFTTNALRYSLDSGNTWATLAANTDSPTVTAGNSIMWKQTGLTPTSSAGIGTFSSTGRFEVQGNVMSLLYGDEFSGQTNLSGKNYAFFKMFSGCTGLTSAENLLLPATTLADECYSYMFIGCTSLTTAPELPATTLLNNCYYCMFARCTSLATAPELPATALAERCYTSMFSGCTSLATAPELPATTLLDNCYGGMFRGCTSLTRVPELPATTLVKQCYMNMFNGCDSLNYIKCLATNISATSCTYSWVSSVASTGTFVKSPSMSSWETGNSGIPDGWSVQDA